MTNLAPAIRIRSFLQIAPYLATRGVSSLEFFRRLGISPNAFQDPDIWLPRALCFRVANEVVAATQDPFGGAHVGRLTELRSLGMWGKSILKSVDVAHACEFAAKHASMLHQGSEVRFVSEGRSARILFRFNDRHEIDPGQFVLGTLAVLRKVPLMAGEPSAIRVHLRSPRARGDDALEECFGPNIETGAAHDMIEFDRALLHMPLQVQLDETSKVTESIRSTVETAGMLLNRLSDHHDQFGLHAIARSTGVSPRTLQRRLKYCGVDFEDLLDETRRGESLRLIVCCEHTITEIAHRVGYSDAAHFTRAFKRWTGMTPSRFRATIQ